MRKHLFLIGFMGAGKSYWGRRIAAGKNLPFVDLDAEIEAQTGKTIPQIFAESGEDTFRLLERDALHALETKNNCIVSAGGGTPCFFDNMKWMKSCGITVYLKMPVPVLVHRLLKEKGGRPLLAALNEEEIRAYVAQKSAQREPVYAQCDYVFDWEILGETGVEHALQDAAEKIISL